MHDQGKGEEDQHRQRHATQASAEGKEGLGMLRNIDKISRADDEILCQAVHQQIGRQRGEQRWHLDEGDDQTVDHPDPECNREPAGDAPRNAAAVAHHHGCEGCADSQRGNLRDIETSPDDDDGGAKRQNAEHRNAVEQCQYVIERSESGHEDRERRCQPHRGDKDDLLLTELPEPVVQLGTRLGRRSGSRRLYLDFGRHGMPLLPLRGRRQRRRTRSLGRTWRPLDPLQSLYAWVSEDDKPVPN